MFRKTTLILLALLILLTLLGGTLAEGSAPLAVVAPTPMPVGQGSILIQAPARPTVPPQPETGEKPPYGRGYIPPPIDLSHLTGQRISPTGTSIQALPSSFDWRDTGKVTPVKHQEGCGSCYAFAALGNIESKMLIDGAGTYDFSENNAKECNWRDLNDFGGVDNCEVGGTYFMMANLFSKKGTVLEADDPYVDSDVSCNSSVTYQKTLLDWRIISGSVPDTAVLKQYIYDNGPVYTSLYAGSGGNAWHVEFGTYDGSYTLYYASTETPNHAVLIVGWDDSLPHSGPGSGGWIVKNSWGTGWGDNGYFTIAYGSASIGTTSSFMHDWQDYDSDGDLWFYDEDGMNNAYGCSGTTTEAWLLAKFIPDSDTYATRVEFWASDITTDVDVYLYDDFDGSSLSNLLAQKLNNSFTEAGYHSVVLDSPVAVSNGDDVIAVVKVTNDSLNAPIVVDGNGPNETGRTYYSCNGSAWTDIGVALNVDIGVRLRTSSAAGSTGIYLPLVANNYDSSELLQNGNFDTGAWTPWQTAESPGLDDQVYRSASYSARLAGRNDVDSDYVIQEVTVPANATEVTLDFWYRVSGNDPSPPEDFMCVEILDSTASWVLVPIVCLDLYLEPQDQWINFQYVFTGAELTPLLGEAVFVSFQVFTNATSPSTVWVDDVSFKVTGASP